MAKGKRDGERLQRRFDGKETLDGLLELAGSPFVTEGVVETFQDAHRQGHQANEVIPTLFEAEPRFADPSLAALLFGNLLGLWDLVAQGRHVDLNPNPRPPRPKRVRPTPPPPFAPRAPDASFVEAAWRYLEDLDDRERARITHAFENRQDRLLQWLDEAGLSDEGYATARFLLFEVFAMLGVGWPAGLDTADPTLPPEPIPPSLRTYADEALFEAAQDEQTPLSPAEAARVRERVDRGLSALWRARKPA